MKDELVFFFNLIFCLDQVTITFCGTTTALMLMNCSASLTNFATLTSDVQGMYIFSFSDSTNELSLNESVIGSEIVSGLFRFPLQLITLTLLPSELDITWLKRNMILEKVLICQGVLRIEPQLQWRGRHHKNYSQRVHVHEINYLLSLNF